MNGTSPPFYSNYLRKIILSLEKVQKNKLFFTITIKADVKILLESVKLVTYFLSIINQKYYYNLKDHIFKEKN